MHGWNLLFGGFIEEGEFLQRLEAGEQITLDEKFSIYIAAFLVTVIISWFIQNQQWKTEQETTEGKRDSKTVSHDVEV